MRSPSPVSSTSSTPEEEVHSSQTDQNPSLTSSQKRAAMASQPTSRAQTPAAPAYSPLTPTPENPNSNISVDPTLRSAEIIDIPDDTPPGSVTDRKDSPQIPEGGDKVLQSQSALPIDTEHTTNMLLAPDEVHVHTPRQDASSTPQLDHGQDKDDEYRAAEFEETSSRARLAARTSAERSLADQSPKRASEANTKGDSTANLMLQLEDDEQAVVGGDLKQVGETSSTGEGSGEPGLREPKVESDPEPPRHQAAWVGTVVSACKVNKKVWQS